MKNTKQKTQMFILSAFWLFLFTVFQQQRAFAYDKPLIIDHTYTRINQLSQADIENAKAKLHIAYGHTSHGSQLTTGMSSLVSFANNHGLGLALPLNIFTYNNGGTSGALDLRDSPFSGASDLGNPNYTAWATATRTYLGARPEVNVIIWSWCGQADTTAANIDLYLSLMNQLEIDYPNVKFVYMTGHLVGTGLTGNLHLRNEQIRNFCRLNNRILYDFEDIESYDPSGVYYGDKYPNDACNYNSGAGTRNWAVDWQNAHTQGVDWYTCTSAHSQPLNANQKAYAVWSLWVQLAQIGVANRSPVAAFTAVPISGKAPLTVTFNASSSSDSDGNITAYSWDFDNNGTVDSTTAVASYTYNNAGSYQPRLTVTDDDGATAEQTLNITVEPPILLPQEYYVANPRGQDGIAGTADDINASDTYPGTLQQPFATIAKVNTVAQSSDTILIRGGNYNEIFRPAHSGAPGNVITYKNYNNEKVVISGTAYDARGATHPDDPNLNYGPIWMENVNYIAVEGLEFTNPEGFGRLIRSNNNSFKNCKFYGPTSNWIIGIHLFESNDNRFENNSIEGTSDNFRIVHSERNVIAGNNFHNGRHVLLTIKCSSCNVIRDNYFYNEAQKAMEVYDCEQPTMFDAYNIPYYQDTAILNSSKHNLIEKNTFAYTAPDNGDGPFNHIQYAGQNGIIRNNIFYDSNGIALGMARYADEALYNKFNRVYNNVFYNNMGGGIQTARISPDLFDNIFKNNILYKNFPGPVHWADDYPSGSQITHGGMANFLFEYNDIINNAPGDPDVIYDSYNHRISLVTTQANYPSLYQNNLETNPLFMSADTHDFKLQSASPMIDAGVYLSKTTASGNGISLAVQDAGYFYDGNGITDETGDIIQLEGQEATAIITAIDYTTNTLTLDQPLTWIAGQGVSLAYLGTAPDLGAYEYDSSNVTYGDVSGDSEISAYDAALTARLAVGLDELTPEKLRLADVNGDAEVSAYDAALIAQYSVGIINKFPVEG